MRGSFSATPASAASPGTTPPKAGTSGRSSGARAIAEVVRKVRECGTEAAAEAAIGDRAYSCSAARLAAGDRIVVTLHDVTEFRALEKTKRDFAVNVSHELKTPLTAIKGFVETMEPRAEEENKPYLEIIRRNTDRLIAIVEDLLVLSQLEDRGQKIEKSEVRVRPLAENILKIFEKRARGKGPVLSLEAAPDLPVIKADPLQVEGLLLNLVDNAVKYTEKGTVTVRLDSRQAASSSRSRTRASASTPRICPTSSSGSTSPTSPGPRSSAARGSACPSSSTWSWPTTGPSRSRAASARGRPSRSACRSAEARGSKRAPGALSPGDSLL